MKTPVSRLQEIAMKKKLAPPEYEIIFSRPEGLEPKFTYQCTFNGSVAEGSGRTKKDAKHESADQLLKLLEVDQETNEDILKLVPEPVILPHCNKLQSNYVGELAFHCLEVLHFIEKPQYEEVCASGASHNPTFTIKCTVSSFTTQAEGSTKKQAKQLASKLMLERLQKLEPQEELPKESMESLLELKQMTEAEKEVIKKVLTLHIPSKPKLENMNKTNEIFKQFYPEPPPNLDSYPDDSMKEDWKPYERLQEVCGAMGENMLSFYNFNKIPTSPPANDCGMLDKEKDSSSENSECVFTCAVTVHARPLNIHCKGVGSDPEKCIAAGADRMLKLLYIFFFDKYPFAC